MRRLFSGKLSSRKSILAVVLSLLAVVIVLAHILRINQHSDASGTTKSHLGPAFSSTNPDSIYAADPADAWNRIFHSLFSRTVKARMSDEFPDVAPFTSLKEGMSRLRISTRAFEHFENGDRAIDPLYPSFFSGAGVQRILSDPDFSQLKQALTDALNEKSSRPPLARALMQSDVWAAYDILLANKTFRGADAQLLGKKRDELLSLLGRFTRKLVLTDEEIRSLPENYSSATAGKKLPDLFAANSPWLEIQMSPHRLHDISAGYRRATRVFLKPAQTSMDQAALLEDLRNEKFFPLIDALALVTQNLLIDTEGTAVPSHLTTEVQIRTFVKDQTSKLIRTEIHQYELSRRTFLTDPAQGGLIEIDDKAEVYLPAAGNDYLFASPQFSGRTSDYPVRVSLRKRCEVCHGADVSRIFTLSTHFQPPLPPITVLSALDNVHGWYVAGRKQERADFQALRSQR